MNKTLIALALAAVAGGANAADFSPAVNGGDNTNAIYSTDSANLFLGGRAEFRGDFDGKESGEDIDGSMEDSSRIRLNVGGTTQITDTLSGFGFYEGEQKTGDDSDFEQRYAYVGLKGSYGALSFGRQDTANVQLSNMSDVAIFTGSQKSFIGYGDEQQTNNIAYTGQFDNLSIKASAILGGDDNEDGYGISAIYKLPYNIGLGLGYAGGDSKDAAGNDTGDAEQFMAGANYAVGGFYTALTYTKGKINNDNDFEGYEFAAKYKFENNFSVIGAYQYQEVENKEFSNFYELTGAYDFNKHLQAYLAYKFNELDKGDRASLEDLDDLRTEDAEDTIRLGLKYTF